MSTPTIRSERLTLDAVLPSDLDAVLEYCVDDELQRWVPLPSPYERSDAEFFTGSYAASAGTTFGLWAIRLAPGAPLLGAIELRFEPLGSATVGFWLGKPHRGQGIMTEALATLVEYGFDTEGYDLGRVHWEAVKGNWASAIVARRNGFRYEGVSRRSLVHRGERVDSWQATLLRDDSRDETDGWPL
jgi:RimJ/RimL family protein N-acetyltransferase